MMKEAIKSLQERIEARYEVNILHVLNGFHMLKRFKNNNFIKENQTYVPFNEAMCWGEADTKIFSDSFIKKRVKALKTTEPEYRKIVLRSLEPLFKEKFDIIVLWFGDDMFCQMNLITVLAYLEQSGYTGDVLFCMTLERIDDILPDAFEINVEGYSDIYQAVIYNHKTPDRKLLPVTYQAIKMYLNYRTEESLIIKYIRNNLDKEHLINDLLDRFPEYGLGDLQYQTMIEDTRKL